MEHAYSGEHRYSEMDPQEVKKLLERLLEWMIRCPLPEDVMVIEARMEYKELYSNTETMIDLIKLIDPPTVD